MSTPVFGSFNDPFVLLAIPTSCSYQPQTPSITMGWHAERDDAAFAAEIAISFLPLAKNYGEVAVLLGKVQPFGIWLTFGDLESAEF
jgi:hypothetical protein